GNAPDPDRLHRTRGHRREIAWGGVVADVRARVSGELMRTTRREFLRAGALGALGLGVVGQLDAVFGAAAPRTAGGDPVVVAVNLFGGNDGLNTIVPLAQYDRYHELRGLIGWQREQLIELPGHSDDFGLNPGMLALASMFAQGRVAIVNGVG